MNTNIYLRVERDGKWQRLDLVECYPREVEKFIDTMDDGGIKRLVQLLLDRLAYAEIIVDQRNEPRMVVAIKNGIKMHLGGVMMYSCPDCDRLLQWGDWDDEEKYCKYCGRRVTL